MVSLAMSATQTAAKLYKTLRFPKLVLTIPRLRANHKTRLAIITGELEVGGVGRVLLNIIQSLPRDRFEILIFTTDPRLNNWAPEFKKHVDRIIDIPPTIGRSLSPDYVRRYLEAYIAKNKMDVIFITNSNAAYQALPRIRSTGASTKAAIYDLLHTYGRPSDDDAFLKVSMPFDAYIDKRIVISNYLKTYYCAHYPVDPDKVMVIYNGLDAQTVQYQADPGYGKKFLGLKPNEQAITYIGRLQEDKSPDRLVELAAMLKSTLDDHHAFIAVVGEGSLEGQLRDRARTLGVLNKQVRFFAFTDRPLDVCAASCYTIIASDLEGIPMSALESMHVFTPVIAPAVGGLPDIITDQKDGFLVPFASDAEADKLSVLASVIQQALQLSAKDRGTMGKQAHLTVQRHFTTMGSNYRQLFESGE